MQPDKIYGNLYWAVLLAQSLALALGTQRSLKPRALRLPGASVKHDGVLGAFVWVVPVVYVSVELVPLSLAFYLGAVVEV